MAPTAVLPNIRGNYKEVFFAQRLADNTESVRNKALKRLKGYLAVKSSRGPGFTDDDVLKIWKGLFYCMYMADKPLVQEDVAEKMSLLIHELRNLEDCRTFIKAAFRTFAREWEGIDNFRMDKFMMFMRRVLRQVFIHLKKQNWDIKEVALYVVIFETYIIKPDDDIHSTPMGIKLHLCGIIMEELAKIGCEELKHEVIMAIIQPYMKVLAVSRVDKYRTIVAKDIFRHLIKQSDLGLQRKRFGLPVPRNKVIYKEGKEEESGDEENGGMEHDGENEDMEDDGSDEGIPSVLDPRAGSVHAVIPQIYPDFNLFAEALQKLGSIGTVTRKNRTLIYKLVTEFQDISQNVYPLNNQEERMEDPRDIKGVDIEESVDKLKNFLEELKKPGKADPIKLADLQDDPLAKYTFRSSDMSRRHKKKKKFKKGKKNVIPIKEKYEKARKHKQTEKARKLAVESVVSQITEMAKGPEEVKGKKGKVETVEHDNWDKIVTIKKKSKKKKKKKKKKKAKVAEGNESGGFDVSVATDVQNSNSNNSTKSSGGSFEVSNIADHSKSLKRKGENEIEGSPKKARQLNDLEPSLANSKPATPPSPNVEKKKKKKRKVAKALANSNVFSQNQEAKSTVVQEGTPKKEEIKKKQSDTFDVPDFTSLDSSSSFITPAFKKQKNKQESPQNCVNSIDIPQTPPQKKKEVGLSGFSVETITKTHVSKTSNSEVLQTPKSNMKMTPKSLLLTPIKSPVVKPTKTDKSGLKTSKTSNLRTPTKSVKENGLTLNFGDSTESLWNKPLQEGEIEIFIKSKRLMKSEKKAKKAGLLSPKVTPKTPHDRTIKINLKQNQEHDFKDYATTIRNSPQIPFSADRLPKAPVLKPSPSPILVKRPALKILKNVIRKSPRGQTLSPLAKKSPKVKSMKRSKAADFF